MAEDLRWALPHERPQLMLEIGNRLAALTGDIAAAAALTCGPGGPPASDAGLWGYLGAAMNQARLHALNLALTSPHRSHVPESFGREKMLLSAGVPDGSGSCHLPAALGPMRPGRDFSLT
jgi:hypothetical protein